MKQSGYDRLFSACGVISLRNWVFMAVMIGAAIIMILPFLWMFSSSLRPASEAYQMPPSFLPTSFNLNSYVRALTSGIPFVRMYANSFIVASVATLGVLLTASMAAFAFSRLRFRGRAFLFGLMLVGLMIPPSLTLIPIYFGLSAVGLLDTLWALILPSISASFGVYMISQFMQGQPRELEEAAFVDGASYFTIFRKISLPQLTPALSALGIITFTATWNNFILPFVVIKSWEKMTMPVGILALQSTMGQASLSVIMAAMTMTIVPLFLVFLIAQRFIIEGMTSVGVKG